MENAPFCIHLDSLVSIIGEKSDRLPQNNYEYLHFSRGYSFTAQS